MQIPYKFEPRKYQLPLLRAMDNGIRFAFIVWARRMGKDKTSFNYIVKRATIEVGNYWYVFPTYSLAKKALWDNIDMEGFNMLNHIPPEILKAKNGSEMKITLINGSTIQLVGTEDPDKLRGANPKGIVFSEYAFQNPKAWEVISPIIASNPKAWVIFNTTPNGDNHAKRLFEEAKKSDKWFTEVLTIDDNTFLDKEEVFEIERLNGRDESFIQREYYCSFEGAVAGAYYFEQIKRAEEEGRICPVPCEPNIPVHTAWDIGYSDATAIIFFQNVGKEIRIIDHYEASQTELADDLKILDSKKYRYGNFYLPHDAYHKTKNSGGKTIADQIREAGFTTKKVPSLTIQNGITQARALLNKILIDDKKCSGLIECLRNYHKKWDDKLKTWKITPFHDWASHSSDAFRYLAISNINEKPNNKGLEQKRDMLLKRLPNSGYSRSKKERIMFDI